MAKRTDREEAPIATTAGEGGIHHGQGAIGYEDFITLVDLWDEEGFVLPSLNNLKEATRQRLRDQ